MRSAPLAPPCQPSQSALDHLLEAAACGDPLVRMDEEDGAYLLHHPNAVRQVLQKHHRNYTLITPPKPLLGRLSLAMSHGAAWQQRRRLLQPLFQPRRIAEISHHVTDTTAARCELWRQVAQRGEPLAIDREMIELSLDTLLASLFGEDADDGELKWRVNETFQYFNARARGEPLEEQQLERSLAAMVRFVGQCLAARRTAARRTDAQHRDDLLAGLLHARDGQSGATLEEDEIIDELMMMMVMGHMSSAMALTWTCYMLARNPPAAERLSAEVDDVLGGRRPSARDLEHLPSTCQFLDETLRLYPPGWAFSRQAKADDEIANIKIPAGSTVILSPWVTQRRADQWPAPEVFDPERFTPERVAGRHPFAYFPFGGGPRGCIGISLAKIESQLILAQLAQNFRFELTNDKPAELEANIALMPRGGLALALEPRN